MKKSDMADQRTKLSNMALVLAPIIGGIILQLVFWQNFGTFDMLFFIKFIENLRQYGLQAGYAHFTLDYPPLPAVWMYPTTWMEYDQTWSQVRKAIPIKIMLSIFYYGFFLGILYYYQKLKPVSWLQNLKINARFLFNIALMESAIVLSYFDILMAPWLLATLYCLHTKKFFWSGIFLATAFLTKLMPIFLLPAFLVYFFTKLPQQPLQINFKPLVLFASGVIGMVVITGWYFDYKTMWDIVVHSSLHGAALSHAYNFDRIVAIITGATITPDIIYIFNRVLFFESTTLLLIKLWLSPKNMPMLIYTCLGILLTYFVWFSGVHENHFSPAIVLVIVLMLHRPSIVNTFLYYSMTALIFLNLFIPYGFGYHEQVDYQSSYAYTGLMFFWKQLTTQQLDIIIAGLSYSTVMFYFVYMAIVLRLPNTDTEPST